MYPITRPALPILIRLSAGFNQLVLMQAAGDGQILGCCDDHSPYIKRGAEDDLRSVMYCITMTESV